MVQEVHPSSEELEAYGLGWSPDADLKKVEEHLLICEQCQRELARKYLGQIEVTIGPPGDFSVLVVSTLEDLWHDYQHFRNEALKAPSEEPAFLQKRFLRAALLIFVAHCAGVVDQWCRKELRKEGQDSAQQKKWFRNKCLEVKCDYLSKRANLTGRAPGFEFKVLRNRIVHVRNGEDLEVFRSLSPSLLQQAETEMIEWLDLTGGALGYERFPNVAKIMAESSESSTTTRSETTEPPTA